MTLELIIFGFKVLIEDECRSNSPMTSSTAVFVEISILGAIIPYKWKKNIIKKFITFKLKFKILPEKIFGFALEDRRQFQITRPWSKAQDTKFQPSWYEKLREQDRRFCELTTAVIPRRNVHSPSNVVNLPACLHPWTIFQIQICYEKGEEILGPLFSILSSFQNSSFWSLFFRLDKAKLPDMLPTSSQINNK